jgi:Spy/CpxP family protein refolding chaperone
MNRKKVLLMALVIALGLLSTLSGWAGGSPANLLRKWWHNDRFAARLDLTADQKHKLDDLFARHQLEFIDLRTEVDKTAVRLEQAMESKNFSEERARKRLVDAQRAKDRLDKVRMEYLLEVRGILSQEQFMKLKKITEERRQRRQQKK